MGFLLVHALLLQYLLEIFAYKENKRCLKYKIVCFTCHNQQVKTGNLITISQMKLLTLTIRVGNFRQKNNSAEDGMDGTKGYFRRNSGYSAEQKISEFRSEPFRGRENNSEFRSVDQ
jgi:hypothetical protein